MVEVKRNYGVHADLFRAIPACISLLNKLPLVHDQETFWAMDSQAYIAHATVSLRQRLLNLHGQLVVAARCYRYGAT